MVESIEFTWPIDGQKTHYEASQLNDKGHTDTVVWDINDNTQRTQIIEQIIDTANSKALKDYETTKGSSLVFILDIFPYFGMYEIEHTEDIEALKQQLKEIKYKVNSVYLLLLPINELIEIK